MSEIDLGKRLYEVVNEVWKKLKGPISVQECSGRQGHGMRRQRSMARPSNAAPLWTRKGPPFPTSVGIQYALYVACTPCASHLLFPPHHPRLGQIVWIVLFFQFNSYWAQAILKPVGQPTMNMYETNSFVVSSGGYIYF